MARHAGGKARLRAFALEPEVTVNNNWSDRHTMVEVAGLDRPGLLFELTSRISKLNLNIASAHVATFGERVVDVFYVTDLFGAKITSATRQAAIRRALISLFPSRHEGAAKPERSPSRRAAVG
jgi:[protein-PII] uridylyltransferase